MKVNRKRIVEETCDINIDGITLLSVEEYEACREYVPPFNGIWWLRSPGSSSEYVAFAYSRGRVDSSGYNVHYDNAVRPALRLVGLKSTNLQIGDWFRLFGHDWTVVSDTLALCNDSIGEIHFREDYEAEDANVYEVSDVKKYVEGWLAEQMAKREAVEEGINEALIGKWTLVSMLGDDEIETVSYNNLEDACFAARNWDTEASSDYIGVRAEDGTWMIWFNDDSESGTDYDGDNEEIANCIDKVLNH